MEVGVTSIPFGMRSYGWNSVSLWVDAKTHEHSRLMSALHLFIHIVSYIMRNTCACPASAIRLPPPAGHTVSLLHSSIPPSCLVYEENAGFMPNVHLGNRPCVGSMDSSSGDVYPCDEDIVPKRSTT